MNSSESEPTILTDPAQAVDELLSFGIPSGFEDRPVLTAAIVVGVVGAAAVAHEVRTTMQVRKKITDQESGYRLPDDDMRTAAKRRITRGGLRRAASLAAATGALSTLVLHLADPYSDEQRSTVDNVAVIFQSDVTAFAPDVEADEGEPITRIQAGFDGVLNLNNQPGLTLASMDDVEISYIMAGDQAQYVGSTVGGDGKMAVAERAQAYVSDESNRASADFAGAFALAEQAEADKILVLASGIPIDARSSLQGQSEEGTDDVSIIASGINGSEVDDYGRIVPAPIDEAGNDGLVGEEDSYVISSQSELRETVSEIIGEQYTVSERSNYNKFLTTATLLFTGLGTSMFAGGVWNNGKSFVQSVTRRKMNKGGK